MLRPLLICHVISAPLLALAVERPLILTDLERELHALVPTEQETPLALSDLESHDPAPTEEELPAGRTVRQVPCRKGYRQASGIVCLRCQNGLTQAIMMGAISAKKYKVVDGCWILTEDIEAATATVSHVI